GAQGRRKQFVERCIQPSTTAAGADDARGWAELVDPLAARAAGSGRGRRRGEDRYTPEVAFTGRHGCEDGRAFGAVAQAVGGVFDVCTRVNAALAGQHRRADREPGVGGVGPPGGSTGGTDELGVGDPGGARHGRQGARTRLSLQVPHGVWTSRSRLRWEGGGGPGASPSKPIWVTFRIVNRIGLLLEK